MSDFNNMSNKLRSIIAGLALVCLAIGFLLGSGRVGVNGGPENLSDNYLDLYVVGLASHFAQTNDDTLVKHGLCFGDALQATEARFATFSEAPPDSSVSSAYQQVLSLVRGEACSNHLATLAQTGAATTARSNLLKSVLKGLLALLVIALLLGALAWYLMNRQGDGATKPMRQPSIQPDDEQKSRSWQRAMPRQETQAPDNNDFRQAAKATPATTPDPSQPQPIGGFSTTYNRGDDSFDKSFIIENGNGDFLGECGVSISEYVTTDDGARNVTAFEIWLFDKNDTHTVTKVIMSDHAFGDEATRAKLAVRGESVLASLNETIALETKALIINANVNDLVYTDTSPARGIFDRFTIDLSAWVKSQLEQSSGSASDMLNF
ncbi:MAG TPA: hypothetical protein ENJ56_04580 [Anaerolineae bacterium]|nr:hypothetical protein [Anaerolineae bacterium]